MAVYILHPPLSLDRLSYDGPNGTVEYRPKSSSGRPPIAHDALHQDPLDLLAAITDHIPNKGQQLVRYFGWYSNKNRGLRNKAFRAAAGPPTQHLSVALEDPPETPSRKACRRTWAQLIEKVYLVSPLVCPMCRSTMHIISFIEDQRVVRKILTHLGMWETAARPPPRKNIAPGTGEPLPDESLNWAAETTYDNVDQVYED